MLYHAGVDQLSGGFLGVDLFFVLSGFLITDLLLRELHRTGRISLRAFWSRRARRLLPASSLVLVATAVASAFVLPALQRAAVARDILWAAGFSANWRFAHQHTDYLAQDRQESPVLHFWSLGVEEQFYVVWPLLILLIVAVVARRGTTGLTQAHRTRTAVGVVIAAVIVASFGYGLVETVQNQPYAFFGTPSRAWQLGVGALLAVAVPFLARVGIAARTGFAVAGLTGFGWALLNLKESGSGTPYPGWLALVPTLSAALLVAAGTAATPTIVGRVLAVRPLQRIGDLSYSWYLWHFPVLILGGVYFESGSARTQATLVIVSLVLAWASYRFVESPLRSLPSLVRSSARSLTVGVGLVAVAGVAACAVPWIGPAPAAAVVGLDGQRATLQPSPEQAPSDSISMRKAGCDLGFEETEMPACDFGDTTSEKRLVLIGDSHAVVLFPPLEKAAKALGWRLNNWTKSACPAADVTVYDSSRRRAFTECDQFREKITRRVIGSQPQLVIISASVNPDKRVYDRAAGELLTPAESRPAIVEGLRRTIKRFTRAGIRVVVVVDPPRAPFDPPTCLAEEADVRACQFALSPIPGPERAAVEGLTHVALFDFTDDFCAGEVCSPVKDDMLLYRDTNHITKTYALTLTSEISRLLEA